MLNTKKLEIKLDGNMWCVLWGDNLQEGISGWGETPELAMSDFMSNVSDVFKTVVYCEDCSATTVGLGNMFKLENPKRDLELIEKRKGRNSSHK